MKISMSPETKDALMKMINEKNNSAVRLYIAGFGWGGPTLGVVLDEQKENDITCTVDGIAFVASEDEAYIFEDCEIIYKKTFFGSNLTVKSNVIGESSCK